MLCSFVLFLSGTAFHIIKAVAQLEIVSLSAGVSAGVSVIAFIATMLLSLVTLIFLTRRCASPPQRRVSEVLTKKTGLLCSFILFFALMLMASSLTAVHGHGRVPS